MYSLALGLFQHNREQGKVTYGRIPIGEPLSNDCTCRKENSRKVKSFHAGVQLLFLPPGVGQLDGGRMSVEEMGYSQSLRFSWAP